MQLVWLSLVPIAISFSYFYRLIYNFFGSNNFKNTNDKNSSINSNSPDLWGTYRSNLYFGLRTKTPHALLTGIAWHSIDDVQGFTKIRHSCELDDHVNFGWIEHDGRSFGHEVITDKFHQSRLSISFLKIQSPSFAYREAWSAKIIAKPLKKISRNLSILFYLGYNGDSSMKLKEFETERFKGFTGWTPEVGNFAFGTQKSIKSNPKVIYDRIDKSKIWMITDKISSLIRQKLQKGYYKLGEEIFNSDLQEYAQILMSDLGPNSNNLFDSSVLTYQFIIPNNEEIELFYFPHDGKNFKEQAEIHLNYLTKEKKIEKQMEFNQKIIKTFKLKEDSNLIPFVKYAVSNLLGGISYFYGDSEVFSVDGQVIKTPEGSLFTDVPARANFPRGFYWDSGFHNILISKWDPKLSMEILSNWVDKINSDGWVGREQILGDEARSKVPKEYITQNPQYSNPPAPLIPIEMLSKILSEMNKDAENDFDAKEIKAKLRKMYPKLVSHFNWFLKTQRANLLGSAEDDQFLFRWRGRSDHHTLTSGLDDYPRGNVPSKYELHVDLLSWMAFAARALSNIKRSLNIHENVKNDPNFDHLYDIAIKNLDQYHWDESRGCYSDVTVNDEGNDLIFVNNTGYVSLFPMLFGLIPAGDEKLERILSIIEDQNQLWTEYGIRSLSKSDPFYNHGDKYWTGPIWINLNYLILSSLKKYYFDSERARRVYSRLRQNLIENMSKEWKRTGFIWEQYNDITGEGQRSRPFSGWSSLIALIIAEDYH